MLDLLSNFPFMAYVAFVPFAASLWADVILQSNRHGFHRGSLLWWSAVVGASWPFCLALAALCATVIGLIESLEWISKKTPLGRWLNEDVRP